MTNLAQAKIILVDDEPDSLNLLHEILVAKGAEVYRTSDGLQCLALLDEVQPTMVVVDLAMPAPDGWQVLAGIRQNPATAHVPVVAVTAFYSDQVARQAYEAGFNGFLRKPIRANVFLDTLAGL